MQNLYDYKRYALLYVDDEEKSLTNFTRAFRDQFQILTASSAPAGYELLEQHQGEIGVVITDQRMPGEKGVQLLEKARQLRPGIVRILTTAYSDLEALIEAVNSGAIYRYITKPWQPAELEGTLKRAMEFFLVQRERDMLLREKMAVLHNLMITDRIMSLAVLSSGLGHHMRNALQAILTFVDLAPSKLEEENVDMQELRNPDFWKDFYGMVQDQIRRITDLLDNLGEASDIPYILFRDEVHIDSVIGQVLTKLAPKFEEKNIKITQDFPPNLPLLKVDGFKFHRLFELLFADEAACLPADCTISVKAEALPAADGRESEVRVTIKDNGPGLPADALRSIFDPFALRMEDPSLFGVNLMACYFIVYHHGGRIEARGQGDRGVSFVLTLPVSPLLRPQRFDEKEFISKVLLNEHLWDKLLTAPSPSSL